MATFGNTSTSGATNGGAINDQAVGSKYTLSEAGEISKLTVYIGNQGAGHGACNIRCGIYDDNGSGGKPSTLLGSTSAAAISDNQALGWVDCMFSSPLALDAGNYYLVVQGDTNADGTQLYADLSSGVLYYLEDSYSNGLVNPAPSSVTLGTGNVCIYATYETEGGDTISIPLLNHLLLGD